MGEREWAMLLTLAVLWGGSFFFNGVAVRELPSFTLVWLRVALAAATLLLMLRLLGQPMPTAGRIWATFFGLGLLNNVVPSVLIVWGQHHIASGLASILNATTPLFTVLVAHLLTPDEKLTPLKLVGVAVGFAWAVFMVGPDALGGLGAGVAAQLAGLAGALTYATACSCRACLLRCRNGSSRLSRCSCRMPYADRAPVRPAPATSWSALPGHG